MKTVTVTIKGVTPYSPSQPSGRVKAKDVSHDDFEKLVWRDRAHVNSDGIVFIPGVSFKLALDEAVKTMNEKIVSKGNQTFSKVFGSGVTAMTDMVLGVKKADLQSITIYANLDGVRGGSKRGNRIYPIIPVWGGTVQFCIFNEAISEKDFERFFKAAGMISGVGRGRPAKSCPAGNGRFIPEKFVWS